MKLSFRSLFWACAAIILGSLLVLAYQPQPIAVDMTVVERGQLTVAVRDEGRTRVRQLYEVTSPVTGLLLRPRLRAGDRVEAGEVIAQIRPGDPAFLDLRTEAEARASLRSAEAALAAARTEAERTNAELANQRLAADRMSKLFGNEVVSREAYDRTRLALDVATAVAAAAAANVCVSEARLDAARVRLLQPGQRDAGTLVLDILAPSSGRVLRMAQESEGIVTAGALLCTLGDPAELEVVAELLSTDAVQIVEGARVQIENWGGRSAPPLPGRVRRVEPFGFQKVSALGVEEQRVNVLIDFDGPPAPRQLLGHGYRVEVAIVAWEGENLTKLPVAALFRSNGSWAVFRVEEGRAVLTLVEIGRDNGLEAEVLAGIEPGARVVLYPGERVMDGLQVVPRD